MRNSGTILLCVLLLAGLGFGVYTVRADAQKAEELRLNAQQRRNRSLEQETAQLRAFVESPLCVKAVKP